MNTITISLGEYSYPILLEEDFSNIGLAMRECGLHRRLLVVTEPNIKDLYYAPLRRELEEAGFEVNLCEIAGGEENKNLETVRGIYREMMNLRFDRKCTVVALGGGIVGDISGFAAATFLRGIPFVQVPTTLLAQVDSSVGGKVGVNFNGVKTSLAHFTSLPLVYINIKTLNTLTDRDYKTGLGEVVKYAVLDGEPFYHFLSSHAEDLRRADVIQHCCEIKAKIVQQDERENGLRAVLNLGHTFGHAYETATHHAITHGEGVASGLVSACELACLMGLLNRETAERIRELLDKLDLRYILPLCGLEDIMKAMQGDKKRLDGRLRFVLPHAMGNVRIHEAPSELVEQAIRVIL